MQCGTGGNGGLGAPTTWVSKKKPLAVGTWNVISLEGKKPEPEVKR